MTLRRRLCLAAIATLVVLCCIVPLAQQRIVHLRTGVPQDWSARQIVFTRDGLLAHPELVNLEPRIGHQMLQRWGQAGGLFQGAGPVSIVPKNPLNRDWNVSLGSGRIAAEMFPAKFSFDPGKPPDCTKDFVVFGLNVSGTTGGQANLVAFNNLYSAAGGGLCGTAPSVMFAYNVSTVSTGKVVTSPVLSLDGKKIAFVESSGAASYFHVLTWTAGQGTIANAAAPIMSGDNFVNGNSSRSSPWIDYGTDTAYLGANNGRVYKYTTVFTGTPTRAGGVWPVLLANNSNLTPPVLDNRLGYLMVGAQNGTLYQINSNTGAVNSVAIGAGTNHGILAPPIVDVTNGTTFVVDSNNGANAVLVELDTATLNVLATANIGIGSRSGTAINLYQPAFDNNYYNNPSTGLVRLCGTGGAGDITPWQYAFGFTGRTMNTAAAFSSQISTSTNARCTGWTEFYNPNVNGGTDYFFFGLTIGCPGSLANGCVVERLSNTSLLTFVLPSGPSGIVTDNYSTASQASSIYLTDQAAANAAYKLTQNGLQ